MKELKELSLVKLFRSWLQHFLLCRVPLSLAVSFCLLPATKRRPVWAWRLGSAVNDRDDYGDAGSGKLAIGDSNGLQPRGGRGTSVALIKMQPALAGCFRGLTGDAELSRDQQSCERTDWIAGQVRL